MESGKMSVRYSSISTIRSIMRTSASKWGDLKLAEGFSRFVRSISSCKEERKSGHGGRARGIQGRHSNHSCLSGSKSHAAFQGCVRRRKKTAGPFKSNTLTAENRHSFRRSDSGCCKRGDRLVCQPPPRLA